MFNCVLGLEATARGPSTDWEHPSSKYQLYYPFLNVLISRHQAIFDACHSCSLLGGFYIPLRPRLAISSFRS